MGKTISSPIFSFISLGTFFVFFIFGLYGSIPLSWLYTPTLVLFSFGVAFIALYLHYGLEWKKFSDPEHKNAPGVSTCYLLIALLYEVLAFKFMTPVNLYGPLTLLIFFVIASVIVLLFHKEIKQWFWFKQRDNERVYKHA
jgi:hypothetical protein